MRKVILLSQLISMSMLFAPRDSGVKQREIASINGLDCAMFKHWYRDCFKTKEIDGVTYFIELPERETKSQFVLVDMNARTEISSLTVSVPGVVQDRFKPSDKRLTRFNYTMRQEVKFDEVKGMFSSMVPKAKQMMQNMLDELSDACGYGYNYTLPLDSIEVQDESGTIYIICGIEQKSSLLKNYLISEPESVRIKIKASKQCPEFYMSRRYLGMYNAIYSALNAELSESFKGMSKFPKVEGYSKILHNLQTQKVREAIDYLQEDELRPTIYIPTYQHDILENEYYESLVFTRDPNSCTFTTEVINDLQYRLDFNSDRIKEVKTFRLSDLHSKSILDYCDLKVSLFCPAPGKFRQSSGNTEFSYSLNSWANEYDSDSDGYHSDLDWYDSDSDLYDQDIDVIDVFRKTLSAKDFMDLFRQALQQIKTMRDHVIAKLSKIRSVEFPLAMVSIKENGGLPSLSIIPSDEGNKLNPKFVGSEGPKLSIDLYDYEDYFDDIEKFLTEKNLVAYRDVCRLIRRKIYKLKILQEVTKFNDEKGYVDMPEVLQKLSFWSKVKAILEGKNDQNIHIQIPCYLRDAIVDKGYELLTFSSDNDNVFKTEVVDNLVYKLTLSDTGNLDDEFRLSDLMDNEISSLSVAKTRFVDFKSQDIQSEYIINKLMSGDEVSEQFKIGLQAMRKLEDMRGMGRSIINASDKGIEVEIFTASEYRLKILLRDDNSLQQFLIKENLQKCIHVDRLIDREIKMYGLGRLWSRGETNYADVPEVLKKQSFWPEVEALLGQIGDDVSISIADYVCDRLLEKLVAN